MELTGSLRMKYMRPSETHNYTVGQVKQQPPAITWWTFTDSASPVPSGRLALPILTSGTWWKAVKAVQQLKYSVPRDHEPPVARADTVMHNIFSGTLRTLWDYDKMA
eukprot:4281706-Pyramimonas_sp.AAC.1